MQDWSAQTWPGIHWALGLRVLCNVLCAELRSEVKARCLSHGASAASTWRKLLISSAFHQKIFYRWQRWSKERNDFTEVTEQIANRAWKWFYAFKPSISRHSNQVLRGLWMVGDRVTFFFQKGKHSFSSLMLPFTAFCTKINSLNIFPKKRFKHTEIFSPFTQYYFIYWKKKQPKPWSIHSWFRQWGLLFAIEYYQLTLALRWIVIYLRAVSGYQISYIPIFILVVAYWCMDFSPYAFLPYQIK